MRPNILLSAVVALVCLFWSPSVYATPREWQLDGKISYLVLGETAARATGGFMPSVTAKHTWPMGRASVVLGADIGMFGFGGAPSWMGVLGGPVVGGSARPFSIPISFEMVVRLDLGRLPVCNRWGLCLRYLGLFPAAEVAVGYSPAEHFAALVSCGVRVVETLTWTGASVEPALSGRFFW